MLKRIFIISAAVFILALGAFFVYKFFAKEKPITINRSDQEKLQNQGKREGTKMGKLEAVMTGEIKGATLNGENNQILFYQDQKFLVSDFDGVSKNSVGAYPFGEVEAIDWFPNKRKAVVKTKEGIFFYDLDGDSVSKLKSGVDVATWSATKNGIFYKYFDSSSKKRSINASNFDGSDWKVLVDNLAFKKVDLISNESTIESCYYPVPDGRQIGKIECINVVSGDKRTVYDGKYGADYLWSKNGQKLLVSFAQNQVSNKLVLGVMNKDGGEYKGLNFPTTIKKCVWSNDNTHIFCSMMSATPEEAVLPNDWQAKKYEFVDTFWKINTENGKKERVIETDELNVQVDSESLFLDKQENFLFFIDRNSESLYRIDLQKD